MHAVSDYGITELHFRYVACTVRGTDGFLTSIPCASFGTQVCVYICDTAHKIAEIVNAEEKAHPVDDQIAL